MRYGFTALLLSASILSIAAGDQPAQGKRSWQLTRDGVMAGNTSVAIPGWILAAEPYACPPELAVGPKGEAVVTSKCPTASQSSTAASHCHKAKLNHSGAPCPCQS